MTDDGLAAEQATAPDPPAAERDPGFLAVMELVKATRGFDVSGYKVASLQRRMRRRMQDVEVNTFSDYADFLEVHPEEFARLFDAMLINVTRFFRDGATWEYLRETVVPALLEDLPDGATVRVWSAGCASGEEAYSLAMTFAEVMGADACRQRVKIYATDLDEAALDQARQAVYRARDLEPVPPEYRERYFVERGPDHVFRPDLRRAVIFGRHDLSQDAPISRVSLLMCRNTLMYFNTERQSRILGRLHFALREEGFLVLGRAEMLLSHGGLFAPVDLARRVFRKVVDTQLRTQLLAMTQGGGATAKKPRLNHRELALAAWETNPVAEIVVDTSGALHLVNSRARERFGIDATDVGRPFQDLELSYRPKELRSHLKRVAQDRRPASIGEVAWPAEDGTVSWFYTQLTPILDDGDELLGVSFTFRDVTAARRLRDELERANRELDTAYEELQSTNEEMETTNEELQSTIEEQETTNEELQSTNEELETLNEELQSTNVELQTMNDELRRKTAELDRVNAYLESILGALHAGVMVVDTELVVQIWNERAEDLWGVRREEAYSAPLLDLDSGLPVEQLRQPIRSALAEGPELQELKVTATNRRGRQIECLLTVRALHGEDGFRGAVILMEDVSDR